MKKVFLLLTLAGLVILGVVAYNYANHIDLPGHADLPGDPSIGPWQPTQLQIPALHIDASIINVGQTADGLMDAPTSQAIHSPYWTSVFWYDVGAVPGQAGNAVIAGHVDRVGGDPAIFWSLGNLRPGDSVYVLTKQGSKLHFVVNRTVDYPANASSQDTINAVFGPTEEHHLNLITCSGAWTGNGYDKRLVVFTTQVS